MAKAFSLTTLEQVGLLISMMLEGGGGRSRTKTTQGAVRERPRSRPGRVRAGRHRSKMAPHSASRGARVETQK